MLAACIMFEIYREAVFVISGQYFTGIVTKQDFVKKSNDKSTIVRFDHYVKLASQVVKIELTKPHVVGGKVQLLCVEKEYSMDCVPIVRGASKLTSVLTQRFVPLYIILTALLASLIFYAYKLHNKQTFNN